jgi:CRP-like cAMP-binding protein
MPLTTQDRRAWLERIPLFEDCAPESLDRLAEVVGEAAFVSGQPIVLQGQVGNGLFIIVSGAGRVLEGGVELARIGPGDTIGELSVIDQQPRVASVIAEGPVTALSLASWDLLGLLERDPRMSLNLLKVLARRLRDADERLRR